MKLWIAISLLSAVAGTSAPAKIAPKKMQVEFTVGNKRTIWTDYLYSPANQKLFVVSLEPHSDGSRNAVGLDLIVRDAGKPESDANLLNSPGNWHGVQPYNFFASDLLHGAAKSVFGRRRIINVKSRGLGLEVRVLHVKISVKRNGAQEIDELTLSLAAYNLPHSR